MTTAHSCIRAALAGLATLGLAANLNASAPPEANYASTIRPFLETYCVECHGPEKQKGDRRYDTLSSDFSDEETLWTWQDIVDQLNLGEMPPSKAKHQPSHAEIQTVVDWTTERLEAAFAALDGSGGETVLRRLNRIEYNRSVKELLKLGPVLQDPTENFPPDESEEHFNNIGATLVTSDFLLQGYLDAAEAYVERAAQGSGEQPEVKRYHFKAPFYRAGNRLDGKDVPGKYQHIRKNTTDVGGFLWLSELEAGVPESGYYTLRFKAQALDRVHPYDEALVGTRKEEPLRVDVVAGSSAYGYLENKTSSDRKVASFTLADDKPEWLEARIWLDQGYQPRLSFPNGPVGVKQIRKALVRKYPDTFQSFIENYTVPGDALYPYSLEETLARQIASEQSRIATYVPKKLNVEGTTNAFNSREGWAAFYKQYHGPRIRVFEIELEGPFYESWPTPSYKALFGNHKPALKNAKPILKRFAENAFRRPVDQKELAVLVDLVKAKSSEGLSDFEALKVGFRATLCSPGFLYLNENDGELDDYALASRLSYFLWSAPPDEALLKLAKRGALRRPATLQAQARRMLQDERAWAFTEQFTERWLELYKLGAMPPSARTFNHYYVDELQEAMRRETQLYFKHILDHNLTVKRFLDSDFTFVNGGLARHYGIDGVVGPEFRKVSLPKNSRRGGLMGHASVLTASANGIDTSPVIRGIWVLENILGSPPSPPPPDVEPLEPDIRGATTIREQLKKHREVETCNECHRKIDPLGFALENFDPIGGWRERYPRGNSQGPLIDASGQLPNGESFSDMHDFKEIISGRVDQFSRCLAEKLLTYSTGRTLEPSDRPEVDRIVEELEAKGNGLQDLVLLVVESDPFRAK